MGHRTTAEVPDVPVGDMTDPPVYNSHGSRPHGDEMPAIA